MSGRSGSGGIRKLAEHPSRATELLFPETHFSHSRARIRAIVSNASTKLFRVGMKAIGLLRDRFGMVKLALCLVSIFSNASAQSAVDESFNPSIGGDVSSLAVQADGKILVGGNFVSVNGVARSCLARLSSNGSLDTTFAPTNSPAQAVSHILARDGKIYVSAGDGLRRLAEDGSLEWHYPMNVAAFAVDSQQRVILGGYFTRVEGQYHRNLARLTANGSLDATFSPAIGCCATEGVDSVATQGDAVFAGGVFQSVNGAVASHIARIDSAGAFDTTFAATATPHVSRIVVMADGKIFRTSQQSLVRHLAGGADDPEFPPVSSGGSSDDRFVALAVAADGKPIVGGDFTLDGGATRSYVARFSADGKRDASFAIAPNGAVEAIAIQNDGRVLIGGLFTSVNGKAHFGLARANAAEPPTLGVTREESGLVLSWAAASGDFVLETKTLNKETWSAMDTAPTASGGRNFVTNTTLGFGQFFRLRARQ